MKALKSICYLSMLALVCCRKPYNPPAVAAANSYLVVEGVIDPSSSDSTIIKLSRTVKLNAKTTLNPVLDAVVTVESDKGVSYPLYDFYNTGSYSSGGLNLPLSGQYRLRIKTGSSEYLSDLVAVKQTPPIDSIGYFDKDNGFQLYINTHDPANATRYYRWDYDETWMFRAKYYSHYIVDHSTNTIILRDGAHQIYYCFGNDRSSNVLLMSTTKLAKDVVYQSPLTHILYTSEKFEQKYSILVKQYALTADAYTFYENIKKNTEQLGSIFDAQPSQINGNIHSLTSKADAVIGYVSVTNIQSKRIYITNDAIPKYTLPIYPYNCEEDSALFATFSKTRLNEVQSVLIDPPYIYLPVSQIQVTGGFIAGYTYSTPICTDCTLRGTTTPPPFWQ